MPEWDRLWNVKENILNRYPWMPQNIYSWTGEVEKRGAIPGIEQTWWRSPKWGPDVIWHPQWGWQSWKKDVRPLYREQAPVPWSEFTQWGLTPHMGEDWGEWYPGKGGGGDTGGNMGGTTMANQGYYGSVNPWNINQQAMGGGFPGYGGQYFGTQQFQYPPQWQTATNVLNPMAYTGMPTYMHPWYQQAQQVAGYDVDKAMAQAREEMGFRGLGKSTAAIERGQQVAGDIYSRMGLEYANQQMNALEQARQRQMGATQQLGGLGQ